MVIEKEIHVYQNLAAVISDSTQKVVQFIGSREGEGTSTVVREFARVSASTFGKLVLLLDADQYHPTQHLFPIFNQSLAGRETSKKGRSVPFPSVIAFTYKA